MNKSLLFILVCFVQFAFSYSDFSEQIIEYKLDENLYAVLVVQDSICSSEARRLARQRAAEVAFEQGFRYYQIESEIQTEMIRSERPLDQGFFGDMYQELIIEERCHKDWLATQETANEGCHTVLRLVFSCYKEKPVGGGVVDICTSGQCPIPEK